jgi:hypothetical protein
MKVKSLEHAFEILGKEPVQVMGPKWLVSTYNLSVIIEAYNKLTGEDVDWDNWDQDKHYPWFDLTDGKVTLVGVCYYYYGSDVPPAFVFLTESDAIECVENYKELYDDVYLKRV